MTDERNRVEVPQAATRGNDYTCAICQHAVDTRWSFRAHRACPIAPLCPYCEHHYTQGIGEPRHGTFRDRREVMRGFAIAEALHTAARHKEHGYAIA